MLGREGQGAFFQSAGTHRTSHGPVILGRLPGSYGAYSLNGGSVMAACGEVIGWSGEGDFHQYAGTNTAGGTLYLAYDTNATASYYLYDGRLNASKEVVGSGGLATFLQYGGKNDVCGDLDVAAAASPNSSSYSIYSGSLVVDGSETIGSGGNASFYQGGGSQQIGCTLAVGELKDSSGWLGLGGGSVQTRKLSVGAARGSGTLEFDDPSALVSVSDEVTFGSLATLVAVQGSAIHMTDPLAAGSGFSGRRFAPTRWRSRALRTSRSSSKGASSTATIRDVVVAASLAALSHSAILVRSAVNQRRVASRSCSGLSTKCRARTWGKSRRASAVTSYLRN